MRVSDLVKELAEIVEAGIPDLTLEQHMCISAIKSIPGYLKRRRLNLWEEHVGSFSAADDTPVGLLLIEVKELGKFNLYGAFQPRETLDFYNELRCAFAKLELQTPEIDVIEGW